MSWVQPPGRPVPLRRPRGVQNPGAGELVARSGITAAIEKGALPKAEEKVVAVVESVQVAARCGEVRFTSTCLRQLKATPAWFPCRVLPAGAEDRPFTPPQLPNRLSKLWFSW